MESGCGCDVEGSCERHCCLWHNDVFDLFGIGLRSGAMSQRAKYQPNAAVAV